MDCPWWRGPALLSMVMIGAHQAEGRAEKQWQNPSRNVAANTQPVGDTAGGVSDHRHIFHLLTARLVWLETCLFYYEQNGGSSHIHNEIGYVFGQSQGFFACAMHFAFFISHDVRQLKQLRIVGV